MSLDLTNLSQQVRQMSTILAGYTSEMQAHISKLREVYQSQYGQEQYWKERVEDTRKTAPWQMLARPTEEPIDTVYELPKRPPTYTLVATDGSQVDKDRHSFATYFLVNIGCVYLRYGITPEARLFSIPTLAYRDEDLYITDPKNSTRRIAIEGAYLAAWRDIKELEVLYNLSQEYLSGGDFPSIMLLDGTLMRWAMAGFEPFAKTYFLEEYLQTLDKMHEQQYPLASYISRPRGTEVLNTILLMTGNNGNNGNNGEQAHEHEQADKEYPVAFAPSLPIKERLTDAHIFDGMLEEGQRGPMFASINRVNIDSYGKHCIHFFYMRVQREMARVEIPQWVADDSATVDLVHSLVYDQCVRGQGYPVALERAHEQAIVRGGDRRALQRMIEGSLIRSELAASTSQKLASKEVIKG